MMSVKMTGDNSTELNEIYAAYSLWANAQSRFTSQQDFEGGTLYIGCLLYTSPSPRDATLSRMPSSA